MRKLVSVQVIDKIESIEGADKIELAKVLGWDAVVKKNEFVEGQKILYAEYDSVLPDGPEWSEFMRTKKFRIKTVRLRGQISQGLIFSCSICPGSESLPVDTDLTEQLGVKKYEFVERHNGGTNMGKARGNFPSFINKTDEIRIQSKLKLIDELKSSGSFYIAVKCDGTSSTFCYDGDEFCACSRNFKKTEDDENIYWKMARKYNLKEVLKDKDVAIQGEIVGSKIQGNRLRLLDIDLFVFDIYDIKIGRYYGLKDMLEFCKTYGLRTVPIESVVEDANLFDFSLKAWLKRAEGIYEGTDLQREGIVVRPVISTYSPILQGRLSFKVINNLYLLSGGN